MIRGNHFIGAVMLLLVAGCAGPFKSVSDLPDVKHIEEPQIPEYRPVEREEGSLWSEVGSLSLYPDRRGRNIGDIITVRIVEDPEAEVKANTNTSRSSSVDAAKLEFLGYMKALAEKNPRLAQNPGKDDLILAKLGMTYDGKGSSDRQGHVKAYVSAVVIRVLPNGNLYVNGRRDIKVNNETQYITLSGIVRPEDISSANEVSSTFVAYMKLAFSGIGPVSDKQQPGWLGRIVDYVWPF